MYYTNLNETAKKNPVPLKVNYVIVYMCNVWPDIGNYIGTI